MPMRNKIGFYYVSEDSQNHRLVFTTCFFYMFPLFFFVLFLLSKISTRFSFAQVDLDTDVYGAAVAQTHFFTPSADRDLETSSGKADEKAPYHFMQKACQSFYIGFQYTLGS